MADNPLSPTEKSPKESSRAYAAFCRYRDLGPKRSLSEVTRLIIAESRGSGLRIDNGQPRKKDHNGTVGKWSREHNWVERAQAWDAILDAKLRERQIAEIEAMAKRQAQQAQIGLEVLMAPVLALARALRDPNRLVDLEAAKLTTLLEFAQDSVRAIPRMQKAERLARGVKVIDHDAPAQPGSTQGGHEWRIQIHQPERSGELPSLDEAAEEQTDEW